MSFDTPSAQFPSSTVADSDVGVASNREAWGLNSDIGSGDSSLVVDSSISGAPSTGILTINDERIKYTSKDDGTNTFSGLTRGFDGSSAAAHSAGDTVALQVTAHHHNALLEEVKAIQSELGASGSQNFVRTDGSEALTANWGVGGFDITNIGKAQGDTLEIINAGAGGNPTLTANAAGDQIDLSGDLSLGGTNLLLTQTTADYTVTWSDPSAARTLTIADPGGADNFLFRDESVTVTNKTVDLGNNTLTGTLAEFNTAVSDATLVSLTGAETLTNKTIDGDNNTLSNLAHGAEVDNPSSGVHGVTGNVVGTTDTQTLTNKTIDADNNTVSNIGAAEVDLTDSYTWTGTHDHSSATVILPTATAPTPTTEGQITWDTDDDVLRIGDGSSTVEIGPVAVAGSDTQVQFNSGGSFGASPNLTWDDNTLFVENEQDAGSVEVLTLSGNRATPSGNDEGFIGFQLSDSGGTQTEYARLSWVATNVTDTSETGRLDVDVINSGSLVSALLIGPSSLSLEQSQAIQDAGTNALTFDGSGNVTLPGNLDVDGGAVTFGGATTVDSDSGAVKYQAAGNTDQLVLATGGSVGINTNSPSTTLDVNGTTTLTGDVTLQQPSQDWLITDRDGSGNLALQAQGSGTDATVDLYAADGDATDNVQYQIFGEGSPSSGAFELLRLGWDAANTKYVIETRHASTGTDQPLALQTEDSGGTLNTDQVVLATDGNVGIGTSSPGAFGATGRNLYIDGSGVGQEAGSVTLDGTTTGSNTSAAVEWALSGTRQYTMYFQGGAQDRIALFSEDIDGVGGTGDILRVPVGQADVDFNGTANDNAFDYVCDDCGWSAGVWDEDQPCVQCGGRMAWHDDLAFATEIVTGGVGLFETHAQKQRMKKLGLISVDEEDGTPFWKLQPTLAFHTSALSQAHRRIEALENALEANGISVAT